MRVFVAGATGVLGRAVLPMLTEAGHTVFGLARTPEKLLEVDRLGAKPMRGDVLDGEAMRRVLADVQPEAVVNLASAIPLKLRVNPKDWEHNDRVRVEGTRNLLSASKELGLRLFVQESVGYVCRSQGDDWIDENAPRSEHPFLKATLAMEDLTLQSPVPTTLLRYGALMAADAWHTQQSIAALRRGLLPVIGDGASFVSLIHAHDAALAIVSVLAQPTTAAGHIFNVTDTQPARMREILPHAARLLSAPPPRTVPPMMAKMIAGAVTVEVLTASYRISGGKIKEVLGFSPRYASYREIWAQIAQEVGGQDFAPSADLT